MARRRNRSGRGAPAPSAALVAAVVAAVESRRRQPRKRRARKPGATRRNAGGRRNAASSAVAPSVSNAGGANPATGYASALMNPGAAPLTGVPDQATTKPTFKDKWAFNGIISSPSGGALVTGFGPTLYMTQYIPQAYTGTGVSNTTNIGNLSNPNMVTYAAQLQETRPVAMSLELEWVYASSAAGPLPSGQWFYRLVESGEDIFGGATTPIALYTLVSDPRWVKIKWGGQGGKQAYLTWAPSSSDKVYTQQAASGPSSWAAVGPNGVVPADYTGIAIVALGCPSTADLVRVDGVIMFEGTTSGSVLKGTINSYTADAESIGNNIMSMFHGPAAQGQHPAVDHGKGSVLSSMLGFAKKAESLATNPTVDSIAKDAAVVAA